MNHYLAINQDESPIDSVYSMFLETSEATIARVIAQNGPVSYWKISVDPETGVPSFSGPIDISSAPRTLVARTEKVELSDGESVVATAEIESRLDAE